MIGLLLVATLFIIFGAVLFAWYRREHPKETTQEQSDDFNGRIIKAKEELANLLGAPGVTDTAELDGIVANWIGSSDKSRHIAGIAAHGAMWALERAQSNTKLGGGWMLYAGRNLALAEDLLESLKVQIDCLEKPQQ